MNSALTGINTRWTLCAALAALLALAACGSKEAAAPATKAEAAASPADGLVLDQEQIEKLGVTTEPAKAASYAAEVSGYGLVQAHDGIAVLVAEVATASAAVHQSSAALMRVRQLAGTPGAFPADALESAERQAAADSAALNLAQQKLTATLGQNGPWTGAAGIGSAGHGVLADLASGRAKLLRATFPAGSLGAGLPRHLRIAHFESGGKAHDFKTATVWEAPADAAIPGRSLFALQSGSDVSEGERVQVWAASGAANDSGVLVPASALVLYNDAWWCFVEKPAGTFARVAIDTSRPQGNGYFVSTGLAAGDAIVTAAAGLLLARELNPSTEAE
jgi:hypothetical protein